MDRQPSQFFLSGLQKLPQRAEKCTELHGEYVEQVPSLVAVAGFLPDLAKDLSAPPNKVMMMMMHILYTLYTIFHSL